MKTSSNKIPVGIVGATGYTGMELMRLLVAHPHVKVAVATSQQYAGRKYSELFPGFSGKADLTLEELEVPALSKKIKTVFLCLPHHESMTVAKAFRSKGLKVLDLSADFRLKNVAVYEKWYGKHSQKELLAEAVYGLPELHREELKKTHLVAVPGCYPTSILLALAPLASQKMIAADDIICDSKSGVSGAGRQAKTGSLFGEVNEDFKPYSMGGHRHLPEIEQELAGLFGETPKVLFSPHLVPMDRGMLSTIYVKPLRRLAIEVVLKTYKDFYKNERFVKILPLGTWPSTKQVRGTNECHLGLHLDARTDRLVIASAIDNLCKGASGQAVQCFNIAHGFPECTALETLPILP